MSRFLLRHDNGHWIASTAGLIDPSDGALGRGASKQEAVDDLQRQPEFQAWLRENQKDNLTIEDFTIEQDEGLPADLRFVDAAGKTHAINPATDTSSD